MRVKGSDYGQLKPLPQDALRKVKRRGSKGRHGGETERALALAQSDNAAVLLLLAAALVSIYW